MSQLVCLKGGLSVTDTVDQECAANIVLDKDGEQAGVYLDDTTPHLREWVQKSVAKYGPLGQTVLVAVPSGRPHLRHRPSPPVVNLYEAYIYGMGCPPDEWLPLPACDGYIVQRRWSGTHGKRAPTEAQFERLLELVRAHRPKLIFTY